MEEENVSGRGGRTGVVMKEKTRNERERGKQENSKKREAGEEEKVRAVRR